MVCWQVNGIYLLVKPDWAPLELKSVLTSFTSLSNGILLCTDVAARRLGIPVLDCIVQIAL